MNKYIKTTFLTITSLLVFCGIIAKAAPLSNNLVILEQPDGTNIECYASGDEFFSYLTDEQGSIVILDDDSGYYKYAVEENGELIPGNIIVGTDNTGGGQEGGAESSFLTIEEVPESYIDSVKRENSILNSTIKKSDINTLQEDSTPYSPSKYYNKTVHNIVIFIRFNDKNFSTRTLSRYDELFNSGEASLKNYYNEVSYDRTNINTEFCPGNSSSIITYTAPNNRSYYVNPGNNRSIREYSLLKGALTWAIKNNYIPNDINLDVNNDGDVDSLTFVVAGNVDTSSNKILWPHQWNFWSIADDVDDIPTFNGLNFYNFSVNVEGVLTGNKTGDPYQTYAASLCHETFHMVFDGPDLYYGTRTQNANNNAVGDWDIMCSSNGGHMNTYLKYRYGQWCNISEITEEGRYTLNPITNPENNSYLIRSPYSSNEYFVLEYRKKGTRGSFEYNIPGSGLIIYRINDLYWGNYDSGIIYDGEEQKEEVYVYRQNPSTSNTSHDADTADLSNVTGNVVLKFRKSGNISTTRPVSNGDNAGIIISDISAASDTISFNVTFTDELQYGFRDIRLAEAVAEKVGKTPSTLTQADMESINSFSLPYVSWYELPYDLTGIEQCKKLTSFSALDKGITDISPLSALTKLTSLDLRNNNIEDISPLSGLTALKTLRLRGNLIEDYTPTQSYYNNLTTKDFSLDNTNEIILRTSDFSNSESTPVIVADLKTIRPSSVYVSYELITTDGDVEKEYMDSQSLYGTQITLSLPDGFDCNNNKFIRISIYERDDYRKKLCSIIVKPSVFDFSTIGV